MSLRVLPDTYHKNFLLANNYPAMQKLAKKGPIPLRALTAVPVWALRSSDCIGSGEFPELADCARWARGAGFSGILVLPTTSRSNYDTSDSPYNADGLCATDPVYLRLSEVREVVCSRKAQELLGRSAGTIARLNSTERVDHHGTRELKEAVLRAAFDEFGGGNKLEAGRRSDFEAYCRENADWLDEHADFRVLVDRSGGEYWKQWGPDLQYPRGRAAVSYLKRPDVQLEIKFQKFVQWLCDEQQTKYNQECAELGAPVCGDMIYSPGHQSSDYYFHQSYFISGVSVGSMPDSFSADGQCWGLPVVDPLQFAADPMISLRPPFLMARRGIRQLRVDHGIGRFNPWLIPDGKMPIDGHRLFEGFPGDFIDYGMNFYRGLRRIGLEVFSENLGVELPYLKPAMDSLGVGEMGVFRWARLNQFGDFLAQDQYDPLGAMCSSTHDITTVARHMKDLNDPDHACYPGGSPYSEKEKADLRNEAAAMVRTLGLGGSLPPFNDSMYSTNIHRLAHGSSFQVIFPMGDVLGCHGAYHDQDDWQINRPGVANSPAYPYNWNWIVPDWPELKAQGSERAQYVSGYFRKLFIESGRFAL